MGRRGFFWCLGGLLAAAVAPPSATPDPRPVFRAEARGGYRHWRRVRMSDLRPGDEFWVAGVGGRWEATGWPARDAGGAWGVTANAA